MEYILIGGDHRSYETKKNLFDHIVKDNHYGYVEDVGTYDDKSCDYPDICKKLCEKFSYIEETGKYNRVIGIIICGSGLGVSMACNRYKGIRCALCVDEDYAVKSRLHNNANVLALGSDFTSIEECKNIFKKFHHTSFEGGRHLKRIEKMDL